MNIPGCKAFILLCVWTLGRGRGNREVYFEKERRKEMFYGTKRRKEVYYVAQKKERSVV